MAKRLFVVGILFGMPLLGTPLLEGPLLGRLPWGAGAAMAAEPESPRIDDFTLTDTWGKSHSLSAAPAPIVVVAFLGVECPLVKLYAKELGRLQLEYADRGVAFLAINSNQQDSLEEMAAFVQRHALSFPYLKDPGNRIADQFSAERTPEIFVLDKSRHVRYRGRVDDRCTYEVQRPAAKRRDLAAAIDDLLAGRPVQTPRTEAVGCHIGRVLKPTGDMQVTYAEHVSRIFQKRCVECHRSGEIAPFPLTTYEESVGWAEMIAEVVSLQRMPPWHASPQHGEFRNDARLTAEEREQILHWVEAGAPQGDPQRLPPPLEFTEGWRIGEPDEVFAMSEKPFAVPAQGEVRYQYFVVDPHFTEDKWIQSAECRPGNRAVVHHIIVGIRPPKGAEIHGHSAWLTATAPGARPMLLPQGLAKRVPAGSKLVFQLHYTPNGEPQEDISRVGFVYADPQSVKREVFTREVATQRFVIPPGDSNYQVTASSGISSDTLLLALFPHMHLRGKSFRFIAEFPDGRSQILLDVPRYEFNWQNSYELKEGLRLPAGTRLKCVAHFDNSEENLANPDPTASVRWGDQTWEEMMIGYYDMVAADAGPAERTERFRQAVEQGGVDLAPLADHARLVWAEPERFPELLAVVQAQFPQVDRIDWIELSGTKLQVRQVAQPADLAEVVGAKTVIPAAGMGLAEIARGDKTVRHDRLPSNRLDFRHMRKALRSSLHVPLRVEGRTAVMSFWSREEGAFAAAGPHLERLIAESRK